MISPCFWKACFSRSLSLAPWYSERAWSYTLFCWWRRSEEGLLLTGCLSCFLWLWTTSGWEAGVSALLAQTVSTAGSRWNWDNYDGLRWLYRSLSWTSGLEHSFCFAGIEIKNSFLELPRRFSSGWEGQEMWMNAVPQTPECRLWGSIGDSKSCCSSSVALQRKWKKEVTLFFLSHRLPPPGCCSILVAHIIKKTARGRWQLSWGPREMCSGYSITPWFAFSRPLPRTVEAADSTARSLCSHGNDNGQREIFILWHLWQDRWQCDGRREETECLIDPPASPWMMGNKNLLKIRKKCHWF